jgi:hypothetical protein
MVGLNPIVKKIIFSISSNPQNKIEQKINNFVLFFTKKQQQQQQQQQKIYILILS